MESKFLDAESILTKSHEEMNETIYNIELKFTDLLGKKRRYIFPTSIPSNINVTDRISFTALSEVHLLTGLIASTSHDHISVATDQGFVQVSPSKDYKVNIGQPVILVEHMDIRERPHKLALLPIPPQAAEDVRALRLQSVNADILDETGNLLFRLSADPLTRRTSYELGAILND